MQSFAEISKYEKALKSIMNVSSIFQTQNFVFLRRRKIIKNLGTINNLQFLKNAFNKVGSSRRCETKIN